MDHGSCKVRDSGYSRCRLVAPESDLMRDEHVPKRSRSDPTVRSAAYPTVDHGRRDSAANESSRVSRSSETAIWAALCGRMNPISTA